MNEFAELIRKASKQIGYYIEVTCFNTGEFSLKTARGNYNVDLGTFEECIAKLKEWATPPKPETITITVPYYAAENAAREHHSFSESVKTAFQEALKPYEVQP